MKKVTLFALFTATASFAATTGHVEAKVETENKTVKPTIKTELKVKETGLSLGAEYSKNDLNFNSSVNDLKVLENSKAWIKYELPQYENINSFVKVEAKNKNVVLEGEAKTKYNNFTLGLNEKLSYDTKDLMLTHKLFTEGEYAILKDAKAQVEVKHGFKNSAFKYVNVKGEAKLQATDTLTLSAKVNGAYGQEELTLDEEKGVYEKVTKVKPHYQTYILGVDYKGVKDLSLGAKGYFVDFITETSTLQKYRKYGIIPEVKYKGFTWLSKFEYATKDVTTPRRNLTFFYKYFKFNNSFKYDFKVNDMLTLTPKLEVNSKLDNIEKTNNEQWKGFYIQQIIGGLAVNYMATDKLTVKPEFDTSFTIESEQIADLKKFEINKDRLKLHLALTPKLGLEYKVNNNLEIKGNVKADIKFNNDGDWFNNSTMDPADKLKYKDTTVKTNLSVKYSW